MNIVFLQIIAAMADSEQEWEELRRAARKLEGDLDVKLSSYAKQGGMLKHPGILIFNSAHHSTYDVTSGVSLHVSLVHASV